VCFQSLVNWNVISKALPGMQDRYKYIEVFSLVLFCAGSSVAVCCFASRVPRQIYQSTDFQAFFLNWRKSGGIIHDIWRRWPVFLASCRNVPCDIPYGVNSSPPKINILNIAFWDLLAIIVQTVLWLCAPFILLHQEALLSGLRASYLKT